MIVKNEAKVIGRCLESALSFVDAVVVSDTGGTDGTVKIVEEAAKVAEKPCFIERGMCLPVLKKGQKQKTKSAFRWPYGEFDFGTARTWASKAAKFWVKQRKWELEKTYLLFLDADMVLVAEKTFEKSMLREAHYRLIQKQGGLAYPNTRIGRMDFDWVSCEPTHEYWAPNPDRAPASELFSLWIDDRDDGGSKGDKYERDARLLRKRLEEDPKNVRAMYYLAQTYYYMAVTYFDMRQAAGGWEGERWYAELMLGKALMGVGKPEEGLMKLIDAAEKSGRRGEPLVEVSKHLRSLGKNRAAYGFAKTALETIGETTGEDLFVDQNVRAQALEEVSITAYYLGRKDEGHQACETVLRTPKLAWASYENSARNLLHYLPKEYDAVVRRGRFEVPKELRTFDENGSNVPAKAGQFVEYLTSSPTIVRCEDELLVNVRLVNYDHERGRWFVARHKDGIIRTENVWGKWSPDSEGVNWHLSIARCPAGWPKGRIWGLEDQRWHTHEGKIWFTATTCQTPLGGDKSRVVLGALKEDLSVGFVDELEYEGTQEYEKNWLPWSLGGKLYLIYGYEPFTVLELNSSMRRCKVKVKTTMPLRMARYRGGTAPVSMPDGTWIMSIHEVVHRENDNVYLHRFIELDGTTMLPTRVSEAFTFHHHGVEYAAGAVLHGENLIVTYGAEERESHWCEIDLKKIHWMGM
jgi:glycosyltransferase involved in cell wall biosynthesis